MMLCKKGIKDFLEMPIRAQTVRARLILFSDKGRCAIMRFNFLSGGLYDGYI
ncbi:hypothetical protein ACFLWR_06205 [Chloroflexota bacterium]